MIRSIGFSIGSALVASILAGHAAASGLPSEQGYAVALWIGAGVCVVVAIVSVFLLPPGRTPTPGAERERLIRDDAELAGAGLIDAGIEPVATTGRRAR
ncbi:MAG: hypothetical protein H0X42_03730 [Solirubrobacterales bacterium]|nr:hypothetical protein [Solirubrobacterales bacterium]